ncbi:MAG: sigma-70 family RNA polymerase sigma factor [Chitinophagaceae bacterium]
MNDRRSDIEIWTSFKEGDRDAFDELFRRYYPLLTSYGSRICNEKEILEDTVHDLFIELWQSRSNPGIQSVKAYFLKAIKYKLYKHFRKTVPSSDAREVDEELGFVVSHDQLIEEKESLAELNRMVTDAVNRLPNRQKEIIYLKIYHGLKYEEISEVMNINYQVARNLFSQSVKNLRELMGKL